MKHYDSTEIEKKWQKYWEENNTYTTVDKVKGKENFYALSEFAYPSGNLHVGHWYAFAVPDIYARYKRMNGYNVLYPMGFDSFGLPAENAAIKRGLDPHKWTYENMDYMKKQLRSMGASFDWNRTLATSDPDYYKWTQWMFGEFYKNGLVERTSTKTNWCDSCKTVLANEQVLAGACERCGKEVVQKDMAQWMLKITNFADELHDDLDNLPWDDSIKQAQREWIGRKEGSEISFRIKHNLDKITYFIIEKSIDVGISEFEQFGKISVKDSFGDWGNFYKIVITNGNENEFIEFTKKHLLKQNPDGGSWYADSCGSSNNIIFSGKCINVSTKEGLDEYYAYGKSLNIPEKQIDIKPKVKSYLMGGDNILDKELENIGIEIFKKLKSGNREILIPVSSLDKYEKLITNKMTPGFWNEYLYSGTAIFIFKHKDGQIERFVWDKDNEKQIHELSEKFAGKKFNSVYSMLNNNDWYSGDVPIKIKVFTTRADTLFGATYVVLAPEHDLVKNLKSQIQNWDEVEAYLKEVEKKSDLDRQQSKEKTGVELRGVTAINPATKEEIPIWVADYVLAHFGTGAVMAVPAHDERDAEFAIKFNLPFRFVILPSAGEIENSKPLVTSGENAFILAAGSTESDGQDTINAEWNAMYDLLAELDGADLPVGKRFCCTFEGKLINSPTKEIKDSAGVFNGQTSEGARKTIIEATGSEMKKTYRLRDWGISRQRYWGTPIPIVYDPDGNAHPIPEKHLPWTLPDDVDHTPDGTAPLARSVELKERTEKIFGEGWTPELDTMDAFVDSTWYYYRYLDNKNDKEFASSKSMKNWMPVDMYFGGAEHTTMHLLYSRFWVKALHKLGLVAENEPYKGRLNRGLILGPDGAKMSKSKGNVIDPDDVVAHVGADTVRMYLAFIGPFNEPGNYPWDPNGVVGVRRFIERVMRLGEKISDEKSPGNLEKLVHKTIKKVTGDVERLKLNTAISAMMVLVNTTEKSDHISKSDYESLVKMFATFAPHAAEEIWQEKLGNTDSVHLTEWPSFDEELAKDDEITLGVQVNGKVRTEITISAETDSESVKDQVLGLEVIQKWIDGKELKKFIYVPGRIINIVV